MVESRCETLNRGAKKSLCWHEDAARAHREKTPDERVEVRGKPRDLHTQTQRSRDKSGERESASDSTLVVGGGRSVTLLDREKESGAHNFPDHEHNESDTSAHHS